MIALPCMVDTQISCSSIVTSPLEFKLRIDYDVFNGSVFQVAAQLNGVPYIPNNSVLSNTENNQTSTTSVHGVPTSAAAKKVLPIFIIVQLALTGLVVGGAFWLAWGDDTDKYARLQDRFSTTFIPAKVRGHQKHDSITSVSSEAPFATELERGSRMGEHRARESIADLSSHAALMGRSSPERLSLESVHSFEGHDDSESLRRILETQKPSGGYLEHRRNTLFLDS